MYPAINKYRLFKLIISDLDILMPAILFNYPFDTETIKEYVENRNILGSSSLFWFVAEPSLTRNENLNWEEIFECRRIEFIDPIEIFNNKKAIEVIEQNLDYKKLLEDHINNYKYYLGGYYLGEQEGMIFDPFIYVGGCGSSYYKSNDFPKVVENFDTLNYWVKKIYGRTSIEELSDLFNRCSFKFDDEFYDKIFADPLGESSFKPICFAVVKRCWTDFLSEVIDSKMIKNILYLHYLEHAIIEDSISREQDEIAEIRRQSYEHEMDNWENQTEYNNSEWDDETIDEAFEGDPDNAWNID